MRKIILPLLMLVLLFAGCARQPHPAEPGSAPKSAPTSKKMPPAGKDTETVHTIRTMITGLDQYTKENILVLNTADGPYVIGPDVSGPQLSEIHSDLTDAHDRVITILFVNKPATEATIAHRRVTGLVIEDRVYELNH